MVRGDAGAGIGEQALDGVFLRQPTGGIACYARSAIDFHKMVLDRGGGCAADFSS